MSHRGSAEGASHLRIDLSFDPMRFSRRDDSSCIQADAVNLPFRDRQFDLITATAVIEHVESIPRFLSALHRLLKPGGLVAVTTPDLFWDSLAGRLLPHFDEVHVETLTLRRLECYFTEANFDFHYGTKFMLSPIGVPFEGTIERVLRRFGLTFTMLNQVALAAKPL